MNNNDIYCCVFLFFDFTGYCTNTLTGVTVGKSSLDPHSHFRQPGRCRLLFSEKLLLYLKPNLEKLM